MELKKRLGRRIQELRYKNNLKQSELAELVGIATKSQSCIETGKNFPSADLIERYSRIFKIDVSEILDVSYIKDDSEMMSEIYDMLKQVNSEQLKIIYRIIKDILC